jgi:hypothetical protein
LAEVADCLRTLIELSQAYRERRQGILPGIQGLVSNEEDQAMLEEFWEFDRKMISHEKYKSVLESFEKRNNSRNG